MHIAALAVSAALGIFVGGWAYAFSRSFYSSFPGVLGHWIDLDGPYNEHLVRDVGAMYLAIAAASIAVLIRRTPAAVRVSGTLWSVFGVLHLAYHLGHLDGFSAADVVGSLSSLTVSLVLGVLLLVPARPVRIASAA